MRSSGLGSTGQLCVSPSPHPGSGVSLFLGLPLLSLSCEGGILTCQTGGMRRQGRLRTALHLTPVSFPPFATRRKPGVPSFSSFLDMQFSGPSFMDMARNFFLWSMYFLLGNARQGEQCPLLAEEPHHWMPGLPRLTLVPARTETKEAWPRGSFLLVFY